MIMCAGGRVGVMLGIFGSRWMSLEAAVGVVGGSGKIEQLSMSLIRTSPSREKSQKLAMRLLSD
jgi:hypothetical protein